MAGLNSPQTSLHFVAIFQTALLDGFRQALQGILHAGREAIPDSLFFFLATCRAAQNVGLLALWNRHVFHFHIGPHLSPVIFQQFLFKRLHLAARRSHQVLAAAFANRLQTLFAHNAAIQHPDSPRLAVLALHHAQDRFHRGDISAVTSERLIAERVTLAVDDERDQHLLAVGTMVARVTAAHHWVLLRRAF